MAENTSTVVTTGTGTEFRYLVAWGMSSAGIPTVWIGITCVILLGLGILTGVSKTRSKDPPSTT